MKYELAFLSLLKIYKSLTKNEYLSNLANQKSLILQAPSIEEEARRVVIVWQIVLVMTFCDTCHISWDVG